MNTNQETSTKVAKAIQEAERTVTWTAEKAGMTPKTIQRKLRGGSPFNVDELARIADALRISPLDLLPSEFFTEAAA